MPNAHSHHNGMPSAGGGLRRSLAAWGVEQTGSLRAIQGARRPAGEGPRIRRTVPSGISKGTKLVAALPRPEAHPLFDGEALDRIGGKL
jgi:hypothetical protein